MFPEWNRAVGDGHPGLETHQSEIFHRTTTQRLDPCSLHWVCLAAKRFFFLFGLFRKEPLAMSRGRRGGGPAVWPARAFPGPLGRAGHVVLVGTRWQDCSVLAELQSGIFGHTHLPSGSSWPCCSGTCGNRAAYPRASLSRCSGWSSRWPSAGPSEMPF